MSLPSCLKPIKCSLIRLGSKNDGGYLLSKKTLKEAESLISFGVLDDCSFEEHFKEIKKTSIFCFDKINYKSYWKKRFFNDFGAAIYNLNYKFIKNTFIKYFKFKKFFKNRNVFLYEKNIHERSLNEIINTYTNIKKPTILKIDIEGSEYRLLKDIVKNKNVINGLIIEFHELDLHLDKVSNFVKELDFKVTHVHANNFDRVIDNIPLVLEMTLEKNPDHENEFAQLPHKFDAPCNPQKKEINLHFD